MAATRTRLQALLQGRVAPFTPEVEPAGLAPNPFGLQVEKLKLRTGPGTVLPAYLHRGPAGAPVVVIVDSAVSSGAGPLAEAARRGLSALYVSTRGRGELEWDEYLVVSDNLMLGDPVLGQRALDLVAVRAALRADPELADAPAVLLALGEDAGLVGLYAQAAFAPYEAAVIGPTAGTYLEAHDRGMPLMSHMQGILRVADLPHVAALAAERPLVWATRWEGVAAVYPAWAAALRPRVGAAERLSLDEALGEVRRLLGEAEAP